MDSKQIKIILDKYWEGETTVQEERELRNYFAGEDIAEELKAIQPMFHFFKAEQEAYLNGDFEARLSEQLRSRDNQAMPRRAKIVRILGRAAAIAAIFLCVFFAYSTWDNGSETLPVAIGTSELNEQEKAEALLAYQEAKAALMLVSRKMRKGTGKAEQGIVEVRKATKVIR
jgi:anti-sigma factor RsiW